MDAAMSDDSLDNSGMCALLLLLLLLRGRGAPGLVLQRCRPWATAACKLVSDTFLLIDVRARPDQMPVEVRQVDGLSCLLGRATASVFVWRWTSTGGSFLRRDSEVLLPFC